MEPRWPLWGWGDWQTPDLCGAAFWLVPENDPLGLGSVRPAWQDVTQAEESPVPTFAYLYSSAVTSPSLVCLCSINLQNGARLVISPWSLFLLISLQNRSTWMLLFQSLMHSPCQTVVQAAKFALKRNQAVKFGFYMLMALSRKKLSLELTTSKC